MPNSLLLPLPPPPPPPPPHTMRYAAGTTSHTGPTQLPALDNPINSGRTSETRPGQQLETAQRQPADLCKNTSGKVVTLHSILLGVGWTCYTKHTLNHFEQLGLDHQCAINLACKLHFHSVVYADKLFTTRHAFGNNNTSHSQLMVEWTHGSSEPMVYE
eukprot:1159962-Pelagomonas_calceolata.AAC.1